MLKCQLYNRYDDRAINEKDNNIPACVNSICVISGLLSTLTWSLGMCQLLLQTWWQDCMPTLTFLVQTKDTMLPAICHRLRIPSAPVCHNWTQLNSKLFDRPCDHLQKHIVQCLKYKNSHHGSGRLLMRQNIAAIIKATLVDNLIT